MARSWWRLLAAFLLILLAAVLHAQNEPSPPQTFPSADSQLLRYKPIGLSGVAGTADYEFPYAPGGEPVAHRPLAPQPAGMPQFASSAAIIFSGSVSSISRPHAPAGQGYTAVTFKVAQAIRGTEAGQNLTIREWAGLWSSGERYRVGERVMLFLYAPSRLGLTSPVSGGTGRFAVNLNGEILLSAQHMQMLANDPILARKSVARYDDFALAVRRGLGLQ